jgi:hypothetical protein
VTPTMSSFKAKITKRLIDSLKPAASEDLFVWDTELTRYGFRIKPSGSAAFLILYRTRHARQRMHTFAKAGTLTPEEGAPRHDGYLPRSTMAATRRSGARKPGRL